MVLPPLPPVPVDVPPGLTEAAVDALEELPLPQAVAIHRVPTSASDRTRPNLAVLSDFSCLPLIVSPRPGRPRAAGRGHRPSRCMPACVHPTAPPVQAPESAAVLDAAHFSPPPPRARIERSKRPRSWRRSGIVGPCHATPNTLPAGETYSRTTAARLAPRTHAWRSSRPCARFALHPAFAVDRRPRWSHPRPAPLTARPAPASSNHAASSHNWTFFERILWRFIFSSFSKSLSAKHCGYSVVRLRSGRKLFGRGIYPYEADLRERAILDSQKGKMLRERETGYNF